MRRAHLLRAIMVIAAALSMYFAITTAARAQGWRIPTPRDTVHVQANLSGFVTSHLFIANCAQVHFDILGTFGAFSGQNGTGFDGRYTYSVPNWNAPFPLPNPPTFNGTSYQIYLSIKTSIQAAEDSIRVLETSYQASHHYTALYQGNGSFFQFRIHDRLNERPDGYYYGLASGGLTIQLAQYTAGVSLQSSTLQFPATNVGSQSVLLDSLASYGIDPLQVDSIVISGTNASDFSCVSQRGSRFSLPNESTNGFHIYFSPHQTGQSYGSLLIYSHNAACADRIRTIALSGQGTSPNEAIGRTSIDFGLTRIGYPATQELVISNSGSGSLQITNIWFSNDAGTPSGVFSTSQTPPLLVVKMSEYPVDIKFSPLARVHYGAWVYFRASSGRVDSVRLTGDGAEPILFITDTTLYFGTVRSGRTSVRYDTIRNTGNWTAHVVSATLGCSNAAAYSVEPNDATFLLDAGTMRVYTITFHPSTMSDNHLTACLSFYFDNAIQPKIIYLSGDEQRPRITYDAKSVDFGTVRIGDTEHRSLMLTNSSLAAQNFSDSINLVNMWWLTGAFQLVGPAPAVLAAGRDSLDLTFTPKGDGPASGWLHMNVNGQIDSIYLYGNGARPMPAFTPPVLSFGVLPTDSMGKQSTFIKDTGDYPMSICNVQIVGDTDFKLVSTLQLPDSLHNGSIDSLRVSVTFVTTSRTGNTHYATLEITYCDGTKDDVPLIAKEAAQFVQFSTAGIDFGKVRVGYNNPKLATFSNGAQIPLSVGTIWATPTGGPFTPMQPSANVGANASASVTVTFAPLTRGAFTGYLHARDGDIKEDSIPLTGIGAAGVPVFSDSLIDFGTVTINTVSGDTELTLTNAGDWPLAARIVKTNDQYNEFTIITPSGDKVDRVALDSAADGGVRGYLVRFSPTHPELPYHEADLAFYFDDGTVSNVRIIGRDRSDFLALDSTSIDFGKVRVNTTSTRNIQVINTSLVALAVTQLQVNPGSEFSATPSGGLTVNSQSNSPIVVSFSPTAIGPAQAVLISHGKFLNNGNDTITLDGIGAQPVPILSTSLIDFGTRTIGTTSNEPFTLSNNGNWPLITSWTIAGPNAADFTPNMPADTSIDENGTANYSVNFLATTPMQFTPRTATITFKEDDGTTFSLDLTASDKAPLPAQIGFGSYAGRPGDKIFAYLKLSSAIPASLGIQHLSGSVQYDPTIASLISIGAGILDPSPNWNVKISNNLPGSFDYDISSLTDTLTGPGNLLMITFLIDANTQTGDVSTLTAMPVFPESKEVAAITQSGTITVENACGSTSIIAGEASATFVNQNTPNPFGGDARETNIPFDVGADNTIITLRILDPTGREIARPIDHQNFAQGRYSVSVSAKDLGTGVFFCEFRPEGKPPQITKMVVE